MAGLIAYEVASQLVEAGEQVDLVVIVGSHNPVYYLSFPAWRVYLGKLRYSLKKLARLRGRLALDYAWERVKRFSGAERDPMVPINKFEQVLHTAAVRYVPNPLAARVVVIAESERPELPDLKTGWQHVLGDRLEVYQVKGDHITIFGEAHVDGLAACLNGCLKWSAPAVRRSRNAGQK